MQRAPADRFSAREDTPDDQRESRTHFAVVDAFPTVMCEVGRRAARHRAARAHDAGLLRNWTARHSRANASTPVGALAAVTLTTALVAALLSSDWLWGTEDSLARLAAWFLPGWPWW